MTGSCGSKEAGRKGQLPLPLLFPTILLILLIGCGQGSSKDDPSPPTKGRTGEKRDSPIDFTLSDITGSPGSGQIYTLSEQKGKVVFLNFWATWCPPCRAEIPELIALYNKYKSEGLLILGIGLDKESSLKKFAEEKGMNYPAFVGNEKIAKDYKVQGIPATYIIDKEGKIAFHHVGFSPGVEKTLEQEITTLLRENL